ncbi:unnamed protein product [Nezara viridula]|uniref:Fe2OG dioxygenase domain-containing protein n=1 Tax=Nezara viridula TaxID=85310 RepID=A0A9P0MPU7_NEZVI|nr:unnamed protein product [Nezara viridula]
MSGEGLRERIRKVPEENTPRETEDENDADIREPIFGPMPTFPYQRFWTRMMLIFGTLLVVYFTSNNEKVVIFAKQNEKLNHRRQEIPCNKSYLYELTNLLGENEKVRCGRIVMDSIVNVQEAKKLAEIARKGLSLTGEPAGGASILDLHSGALSAGKNFVNLYALNVSGLYSNEDFDLYKTVRRKVHEALAFSFDLPSEKLFLTKPTFFSRLTAKPPATVHDEYWHSHVDKETYESFHYTSLIYLNDFGIDFEGGRFVFDDPDNHTSIIEPKTARVLMFSSGGENIHRVEKVLSGQRFAITISFTCDKRKAISDPSITRFGSSKSF